MLLLRYMNFTKQTKILLAVLVVVAVLVSLYFLFFFNSGTYSPIPFFGHATPTENTAPGTASGKPTGTTGATNKSGPGYTITTDGKLLVITSPIAGVSLVAPINTEASVNGGVLSITHSANDSKEFNPGNVVNVAHIVKMNNLSVDGVAAIKFHITTTDSAARDFYLTWVHSGITNWYIVRTADGATPLAKASLDTITNSIHLVR
jgi:hypothetical protein